MMSLLPRLLFFILPLFFLTACKDADVHYYLQQLEPLHIESKACLDESDKYCAKSKFDIVQTQHLWLNELLSKQVLLSVSAFEWEAKSATTKEWQTLTDYQERWSSESVQELTLYQQDSGLQQMEYELIAEADFISQRYQVASFKVFVYQFTGGAHGMYATRMLHVDLEAKKILTLDDVIVAEQSEQLEEMLYDAYLNYNEGFAQDWQNQENAIPLLHDNFVITDEGLTFIYPVYELAPYVEGEVRLTLPNYELKGLIKERYLL